MKGSYFLSLLSINSACEFDKDVLEKMVYLYFLHFLLS